MGMRHVSYDRADAEPRRPKHHQHHAVRVTDADPLSVWSCGEGLHGAW